MRIGKSPVTAMINKSKFSAGKSENERIVHGVVITLLS
jgi:hypothetical protein